MIQEEYRAPIHPTPTVNIARVKVIWVSSLLTTTVMSARQMAAPMWARVLATFLTTAVGRMLFLINMSAM